MTISAKVKKDEQLQLRANMSLIARDRFGRIKYRRKVRNLVVAVGRNLVVEMLGGTNNAYPTHLALGTGTTAVADGDTALQAESYRDLITRRRNFSSRIQYQLFLDSTQGNGVTYTEAGLFNVRNAVSVMFARVTFVGVPKDASTNITVSWDIYLSAS